MADFFGDEENRSNTDVASEEVQEPIDMVDDEEYQQTEDLEGDYQQQEMPHEQDVAMRTYDNYNDINVTISDRQTPVVILFGPPACGKTMTLVRLSRYLKSIPGGSYMIQPIRSFRPSDDMDYKQMCEDFPQMLNSETAAKSTSNLSFMLVSVTRNAGEPVCQILEAPGELYFNPNKPSDDSPLYLDKIQTLPNRKVWVILLEPDWRDPNDRANYVDRIKRLKTKIDPRDRVIFLGNKVDKVGQVIKWQGHVNTGEYMNMLSSIKGGGGMYPGLFNIFKETRPIISWFKPYSCDFVPFSTGVYHQGSRDVKFSENSDNYPKNLWKKILKNVGK